jgi:hypothetical protein
MTTGIRSWHGQFLKSSHSGAQALVEHNGQIIEISGRLVSDIKPGSPCYIMEHLNIDGEMEFMIGEHDILVGNQNFVNFGIPCGKHIRIDIYTGDSKVME